MNPNTPRDRGAPGPSASSAVDRGLETRELLASHPLGPALPGRHYPAPDVQQFVPILYPPGTPQPTAAEIPRESFDFKGTGHYTIGPGRLQRPVDHDPRLRQAGDQQPVAAVPLPVPDHRAVELPHRARSVYGNINFVAGNYLQNSADLDPRLRRADGHRGQRPAHAPLLDLGRQPGQLRAVRRDGLGLPGATRNFPSNYFNAQGVPVSPLSQGLPPTSVNNWGLGLGDATLKYVPDAHPQKGSLGSGTVVVVMHGLMNYSGAQSQADKNIN